MVILLFVSRPDSNGVGVRHTSALQSLKHVLISAVVSNRDVYRVLRVFGQDGVSDHEALVHTLWSDRNRFLELDHFQGHMGQRLQQQHPQLLGLQCPEDLVTIAVVPNERHILLLHTALGHTLGELVEDVPYAALPVSADTDHLLDFPGTARAIVLHPIAMFCTETERQIAEKVLKTLTVATTDDEHGCVWSVGETSQERLET
mmetsp:Transcript_56689/g.133445  ORF Transcript_56689/g.133445 Transcript_56689/m.133445 type:complete len:203 (-) Transcript_56689:387-995(-)